MANQELFSTRAKTAAAPAEALESDLVLNQAGGVAFEFKAKHTLAQAAATGCLGSTFYSSGKEQLESVKELCKQLEPKFIAQTAVYAREQGHMKDMPALLTAVLAQRSPEYLEKAFPRVIDDGKMLRNFVQIIRSGEVGKRSLSGTVKRLIHEWLEARSDDQIFRQSIGNSPSFGDVVKLAHPKPGSASREALYGYLIGRCKDEGKLPPLVQHYEAVKRGERADLPEVPFMRLTSLPLSKEQWTSIALSSSWQILRQNLNAFQRHGVFENEQAVEAAAAKLRDPEAIAKARVMPYQLLAAFRNTEELPGPIRDALQDAMERATANVPRFQGKVYVLPDVSGSMNSPVTGYRGSATTSMRYVDVAGLVASAILRNNPGAEVIPFEQEVTPISLNPRDTVMTNSDKLAEIGGGGTNCSAPLALLNERAAKGDFVIYVSDNQSWVDSNPEQYWRDSTQTMVEWERFKSRNPTARMACIDIAPYGTTQAQERSDILNIGGFSDDVFKLLGLFQSGAMEEGHWVAEIEAVDLDRPRNKRA